MADKERSANRHEFIKQLFSVAIGVGFGTSLLTLPQKWLGQHTWPTWPDWQQFFLLIMALVVTVLSWDGYILTFKKAGEEKDVRFVIDITLVFAYIILMYTSKNSYAFMSILAVIFFLYFVWDLLTVLQFPRTYDFRDRRTAKRTTTRFCQLWSIYWGGLRRSPHIGRGPIITFLWAAYFWVLLALLSWSHISPPHHFHIILVCLFSLYGLFLYRWEKHTFAKYAGDEHVSVGFGVARESGAIILGLAAAACVFYVYRV